MDTEASSDLDRRAIAVRAGLVGPVVAIASILLATLLDPSFSWSGSALSHTGELPPGRELSPGLVADRPSFLVFNGGLIVTGVLGLAFAWLLYADAVHPLERSGSVLFGLAMVSLVGVGVFYLPKGYHAPAAIVHFVATVAFLWIYGVGAAQGGRLQFGAVTTLLGVVVLGAWLLWSTTDPPLGIAVPEFVGALALGGWTFVAAARKLEAAERDALVAELGGGS